MEQNPLPKSPQPGEIESFKEKRLPIAIPEEIAKELRTTVEEFYSWKRLAEMTRALLDEITIDWDKLQERLEEKQTLEELLISLGIKAGSVKNYVDSLEKVFQEQADDFQKQKNEIIDLLKKEQQESPYRKKELENLIGQLESEEIFKNIPSFIKFVGDLEKISFNFSLEQTVKNALQAEEPENIWSLMANIYALITNLSFILIQILQLDLEKREDLEKQKEIIFNCRLYMENWEQKAVMLAKMVQDEERYETNKELQEFSHFLQKAIREIIRGFETIRYSISAQRQLPRETAFSTRKVQYEEYQANPQEVGKIFGSKEEPSSPEEILVRLKETYPSLVDYYSKLKEIKDLLRNFQKFGVIETPDVKKIINETIENLNNDPPITTFLWGAYGTGKTAIACHIARTFSRKEPIIVNGNRLTEPDEFLEEISFRRVEENGVLKEALEALQSILGEKVNFTSEIKELEKLIKENKEVAPSIAESIMNKFMGAMFGVGFTEFLRKYFLKMKEKENWEELSEEERRYLDDVIEFAREKFLDNPVQTVYTLGALYKAMKEGRVLIIDEANALDPSVVIALNYALTRKIGEIVPAKSGEFRVQKGFGVIWTGNVGEKYTVGRVGLRLLEDPAAMSRIIPIDVSLVNQACLIQEELGGYLEKRFALRREINERLANLPEDQRAQEEAFWSKENIERDSQIFTVALIYLLHNRIGMFVGAPQEGDPYQFFKDLFRLSIAVRLIFNYSEELLTPQEREMINTRLQTTIPGVPEDITIQQSFTFRELLDRVLANYRREGGRMDLEYYLFEKYIKPLSEFWNPLDVAVIYNLLQMVGFFNTAEGWPDSSHFNSAEDFRLHLKNFDLANVEKYQKDEFGRYHMKESLTMRFIDSIELAQILLGPLPELKEEELSNLLASSVEVSEMMNILKDRIEEFENTINDLRTIQRHIFEAIKNIPPTETEQKEGILGIYNEALFKPIGFFKTFFQRLENIIQQDITQEEVVNQVISLVSQLGDSIEKIITALQELLNQLLPGEEKELKELGEIGEEISNINFFEILRSPKQLEAKISKFKEYLKQVKNILEKNKVGSN